MNELLEIKIPKFKKLSSKSKLFLGIFSLFLLASFLGFLAGAIVSSFYFDQIKDFLSKFNINIPEKKVENIQENKVVYIPQTSQEEAIIKVVKEASPSVVNIIITKDVPVFEEYFYNPFEEFEEFFGPTPFEFKIPGYRQKGTEKKEIGSGTGFIISEDGLILTNKHVVIDEEAQYTVFTPEGEKYQAKVLAKDPIRDIAILKITSTKKFKSLKLGDSETLQIGQTVIAIGNALGEFKNTVSVGVISGLGRTITASGGGIIETIEDVIQTDAAINKGNSGGPLLNLKGEVIGINTATVLGAENIGFAIPINQAKKALQQFKEKGKITYAFLGVRYVLITSDIQKEYNLPVDYGVLIIKGEKGEPAIFPNSPAEKAGLKEGDIILEFNNQKITPQNSLAKLISKQNPGDEVFLKILRDKKEFSVKVILGERSE